MIYIFEIGILGDIDFTAEKDCIRRVVQDCGGNFWEEFSVVDYQFGADFPTQKAACMAAFERAHQYLTEPKRVFHILVAEANRITSPRKPLLKITGGTSPAVAESPAVR
jgi:hypothetical protein